MNSTAQTDKQMTTFESSIFELQRRVDMVPNGWTSIYVEMIARLIAINCKARANREISRTNYDEDEGLVIFFHRSDRVIRGILRKMRAEMKCTCQICGKKGKQFEIKKNTKVLCPQCHAPHLLDDHLENLMERLEDGNLSSANVVLTRKDFEPEVLPLIPPEVWHQIKVSDSQKIDYVSAADLRKLQPRFAAIQRYAREQTDLEA
jgi:hypothetical protein